MGHSECWAAQMGYSSSVHLVWMIFSLEPVVRWGRPVLPSFVHFILKVIARQLQPYQALFPLTSSTPTSPVPTHSDPCRFLSRRRQLHRRRTRGGQTRRASSDTCRPVAACRRCGFGRGLRCCSSGECAATEHHCRMQPGDVRRHTTRRQMLWTCTS